MGVGGAAVTVDTLFRWVASRSRGSETSSVTGPTFGEVRFPIVGIQGFEPTWFLNDVSQLRSIYYYHYDSTVTSRELAM